MTRDSALSGGAHRINQVASRSALPYKEVREVRFVHRTAGGDRTGALSIDLESQMPDGSYISVISAPWAATALVLAAGPVAAHDFWIVPAAFRPEVGEKVGLSLRVGEHFRGEPVLIDRTLVERFFAIGPAGESPITPRQGSEPAGFVLIGAPGLWIVGYRSRPSRVSLEAEQFERYLLQEGLETIVELRAARGESGTRAQEIFPRCAKALLSVGAVVIVTARALVLTE